MRPCMDDQFRRLDMEDGNFVPQFGAPRFVFILSGDVKLGWILKEMLIFRVRKSRRESVSTECRCHMGGWVVHWRRGPRLLLLRIVRNRLYTIKPLLSSTPTIKANRVLVIWLEYPNSHEVPKSKRNLNQNPIARVHESATTLAESPCMGINTLEAPRLPLAHHPSTESDTAAFCPPRMGRKSIHHARLYQIATSQTPNLVGEMASKLWPVNFFSYKMNQEWPSIHVPI